MAAPAAAETTLVNCQGTCGYYEVYDMGPPYGANCIYERISQDLDSMSARPPLMHGNYGSNSTVQWRFKVLRAGQSSMSYSTIYTSLKQAAVANDSTPAYAGSGFSRRSYTASENPSGKYKIQIEMWWKHHGSVEGYAKIEYDNYKQLWNGNNYSSQQCCQFQILQPSAIETKSGGPGRKAGSLSCENACPRPAMPGSAQRRRASLDRYHRPGF